MSSTEIIAVKQLPVIVEQLQTIKEAVTERTEKALALVCTDETLTAVKKERAELTKEFKAWEEKRKEVKKAVMSPYEQFESVYKDCITDVFKIADEELKRKIDAVEQALKDEKTAELKAYFDEYLQSKNIDFLTFDRARIDVTKSASKKSLKEQAKSFIDRVSDDLALIDTQENKAEILTEYKQSLNVSAAITTVVNRHKAIEEEKAKEKEREARAEAEKAAAAKVASVLEEIAPPVVEPIAAPAEEEKIYTLTFTVKGTKPQLKALKEFLINGGFDYE